jgi:NAD(P)-dependent dehydrogenase (short-subunit alcohol dehydrogenase family)
VTRQTHRGEPREEVEVMTEPLEGRVAVVTGAGRGIGAAAARQLAIMGASVVVNDPGVDERGGGADRSPADAVVRAIGEAGGKAVASYDSVAEYDSAGRIIETARREFGGIDILVNNAGIAAGAPIAELDPELFATVVGVHVHGTFNCTRHAVPDMIEAGWGRIVNLVSRAGLLGSAGAAAYAAGKGGIYGFTNAVARDLEAFGVTVNNVNPAATHTRMVDGAIERAREQGMDEASAERMRSIAQGPEEPAMVIAFLCTEEAGGISGQTFFVQNGAVGLFAPLEVTQTLVTDEDWTPESLAEAARRLRLHPLGQLY